MRHTIITSVAIVALAVGLHAQATTTKAKEAAGAAEYTTEQMTGEVVLIEGNSLYVKMQSGKYRVFNVPPGRQFIIDGQARLIGELKPGTILTATVVTKNQPVTVRTTTALNGTVSWVAGNYVVLTLENGENREYTVPESYRFTVSGKPATVYELKKGMKVSGTKIVAEPQTEISTQTVVTGKAPK